MKLVFLIFSLLMASQSFACSCVKRSSVDESSKWAKHVFVGKIDTISTVGKSGFAQKHYDLKVVETIKGSPINGYFIKPSPGIALTNCYPQKIEIGDLYVFFVKYNKETTLHHCSSTKSLKYLNHYQPK